VCGSVLQCVAVCCSVLQCVAVRCSVLQCVARLQSPRFHPGVLQCVAVRCVCCSVLQCVAVCCNVSLDSKVLGSSQLYSCDTLQISLSHTHSLLPDSKVLDSQLSSLLTSPLPPSSPLLSPLPLLLSPLLAPPLVSPPLSALSW